MLLVLLADNPQPNPPNVINPPAPNPGPGPAPVQPGRAPSPKVIYVPRNVYVPVVKPVFVPRERMKSYDQIFFENSNDFIFIYIENQ